jgi:hypothetical protein
MLGTAHDEATPLLGRLEEQQLLTSLFGDVALHGQALVLLMSAHYDKAQLAQLSELLARLPGAEPADPDGNTSSLGTTGDRKPRPRPVPLV